MTREELIAICEKATVPQSKWWDRDSAGAIQQMGMAWALLKAGCEFRVIKEDNATDIEKVSNTITDEKTIWIDITYKGFRAFEGGDEEMTTFCLPTKERLKQVDGDDWY